MRLLLSYLLLLLLYPLVIGACVLWWVLFDALWRRVVKPPVERWLWHRLGGHGPPPTDDDRD